MTQPCSWNTKSLSDFVGNESAVDALNNWFGSLIARKPNTKRAALLVGPCGVGKSLLAELLLAEAGYDVIISDCGELRSQKSFKEKLENASSHSNVSKALGSQKPFALIVDDVDQMTSRNGLSELIKLLNPLRGKRSLKQVEKDWYTKYWPLPVICIASCHETDTKLADLKKDCQLIKLEDIGKASIEKTMHAIATRDALSGVDVRLVSLVAGDFRRMLHIMSDVKIGVPIEYIIKNHSSIKIQSTLKENTLKAFNDILTIQQSFDLFEEDKHQLPQMIYENYPGKVNCMGDAQEVLENLCLADSLGKANPEVDRVDSVAKLHALLTIYCCNVIFNRCKDRLKCPKATTAFSRTSAMQVTAKKIAFVLNSGNCSNLHLQDLQVLFAMQRCCGDLDDIGIKQPDLDKLATKLPFLANESFISEQS